MAEMMITLMVYYPKIALYSLQRQHKNDIALNEAAVTVKHCVKWKLNWYDNDMKQ